MYAYMKVYVYMDVYVYLDAYAYLDMYVDMDVNVYMDVHVHMDMYVYMNQPTWTPCSASSVFLAKKNSPYRSPGAFLLSACFGDLIAWIICASIRRVVEAMLLVTDRPLRRLHVAESCADTMLRPLPPGRGPCLWRRSCPACASDRTGGDATPAGGSLLERDDGEEREDGEASG